MKLIRSTQLSIILLAVASASLMSVKVEGSPRDGNKAVLESSTEEAQREDDKSHSLRNGFYAILREGLTPEEVRMDDVPHAVLVYDRQYSELDKNEPPKYVAIDTSFFVPLVMAGSPDTQVDDRGWTLLSVTLAREYVKTLEEFTRVPLNGKIAIVLGGEIITMHKVRTVLRDGRAQITRCSDDACQTSLLKLAQ